MRPLIFIIKIPMKKVLIDLKPALDGYAGIPQETRLLFSFLLNKTELYQIRGLLQLGASNIKAKKNVKLSENISESLRKDAMAILSFYPQSKKNWGVALRWLKNEVALFQLILITLIDLQVRLKPINVTPFPDFIWSRLFSKTLKPTQRSQIQSCSYVVMEASKKLYYRCGLVGRLIGLVNPFPRIDTRDYDVFITQTPFPGRVSRNTTLIVRYHDAIPLLLPYTVKDRAFHLKTHFYPLKQNVNDGAIFACDSEASKRDLLRFFPNAKAVVIHVYISEIYSENKLPRLNIHEILRSRLHSKKSSFTLNDSSKSFKFFLTVGSIEPRKNHRLLLEAITLLRNQGFGDITLVVVGSQGWDNEELLKEFELHHKMGSLIHLSMLSPSELCILYQNAIATICPSISEGFDYPGVEAIRSGGIIAASDIAVHREIYGDAALYFDPYDAQDVVNCLKPLLAPENTLLKKQLYSAGKAISARLESETLSQQWKDLIYQASSAKDHRNA